MQRVNKKNLIILALFLITLYIILPQLGNFKGSIRYLEKPDLKYLVLSLGSSLLTFVFAATSYYLLAFRKLKFKRVLLIELSSAFINSLLPAGIGAIGSNYTYLRHEKHTTAEATSVVGVNNFLGLIGHGLLLISVLLLSGSQAIKPHISSSLYKSLAIVLAGAALIAIIFLIIYGEKRLGRSINRLIKQLASYSKRKKTVVLTLMVQLCLTISNVAALYFALKAVNIELSFSAVLIIFTLGSALKNATPTPGGIGGIEAGLYGAILLYSITKSQALAGVLFFRLANYWIPLLIGVICFIIAEKKNLYAKATSESG